MRIFIGSSSEAKESGILDDLASWLEEMKHQPLRWDSPSVFVGGMSIFDRLVKLSKYVDAAVLVFTGDDSIEYREVLSRQPRDNVLLEYGLFSGALGGAEPVLIARYGSPKIKMPSDLGGIIYVELDPDKPNRSRVHIREWVKHVETLVRRGQEAASGQGSEALTPDEQLALGLILTDPRAGDRGTWIYPLHQQLTYRGLADARATAVLQTLARKGIIEYQDVEIKDSITGEDSAAPAYRVTSKGFTVAEQYERVRNFREEYHYVIRLRGDEEQNAVFLDHLRKLPTVERQTRFIVEDEEDMSKIAVWSYEPFSHDELLRIASSSERPHTAEQTISR